MFGIVREIDSIRLGGEKDKAFVMVWDVEVMVVGDEKEDCTSKWVVEERVLQEGWKKGNWVAYKEEVVTLLICFKARGSKIEEVTSGEYAGR
jgi:hypothetical protein